MAVAVPLSRFTSQVGGGSALFVRHTRMSARISKASFARLWFFTCEGVAAISLFVVLASNGRARDFYWDAVLCVSAILFVTSAVMIRTERHLAAIGFVTSVVGLLIVLLCPHIIE